MADPTTLSSSKSKRPVASAAQPKTESSKFGLPNFEVPKFVPKFEVPNVEMPAAFRELAEKGIAQVKETYERMRGTAEQASEMMEGTYSTASKGYVDYGLKLIEAARRNSNAAFDLAGDLLAAKSYAEVVEKTTSHIRTQFDSMTEQTRDLSEHLQKVNNDIAAPLREGFAGFTKQAGFTK